MTLDHKVSLLTNHFEFGKAMETVRQGKIFTSLPFEQEDLSLFPNDARVIYSEKYHSRYGEQIVPEQFSDNDVNQAIKLISISSAPGISGISYSHLKGLKEKGAFPTNFA